jgi:hypothetical protein
VRRVLLDEQLPKKLLREFTGFFVRTVPQMGWSGLKNGPLSQRIAGEFDVFVTGDKNIPHQLSVSSFPYGVILFDTPSTKLEVLLPYIPAATQAASTISPGELIRIGST